MLVKMRTGFVDARQETKIKLTQKRNKTIEHTTILLASSFVKPPLNFRVEAVFGHTVEHGQRHHTPHATNIPHLHDSGAQKAVCLESEHLFTCVEKKEEQSH